MNRATDDRILIKGMRGTVVDLSFAHTKEEVVVGAVDSLGEPVCEKGVVGGGGCVEGGGGGVDDAQADLVSLSTRTCDG